MLGDVKKGRGELDSSLKASSRIIIIIINIISVAQSFKSLTLKQIVFVCFSVRLIYASLIHNDLELFPLSHTSCLCKNVFGFMCVTDIYV